MHFVDEKNGLKCEVEVDPQPQQSYISSWFRSKKSLGYKPDLVRAAPDTAGGHHQGKTTCLH
jgi:hypothetical protein